MKNSAVFWILSFCFFVQACGGSAPSSSNLSIAWSGTKQLGAVGKSTFGNATASDATGVYIVGDTPGGLDGNVSVGTMDVFLTKYDLSGMKLWTKQLGAPGVDTFGHAVAVDATGVYITGQTAGSIDGNLRMGNPDFFIIKFSLSGVKLWSSQLGVIGSGAYGASIVTDSTGVYVSGNTDGALDGNSLTGIGSAFVTKYSPVGIKLWTRVTGAAGGNTNGEGVVVYNGVIYSTGSTTVGLDGNTLTGTNDYFFTKYTQAGVKIGTVQSGVAGGYSSANSIAADPTGIYVTGSTASGMDGNVLTGTSDVFLTKFDFTGVKIWTRQFGAPMKGAYAESLGVDSSGIYIAGYTNGGIGGNNLTGTRDGFIVKFSLAGIKTWTSQFGVAGSDTRINGMSVSSDGTYVAGRTSGRLDGNVCTGTNDAFLSKYSSSGLRQ